METTVTRQKLPTERVVVARIYGPKSSIGAIIDGDAGPIYIYGRYQKQYPMSCVNSATRPARDASDADIIDWFDALILRLGRQD